MKLGRIRENIMRRSVLKHIAGRRDDVMFHSDACGNCAAVSASGSDIFVYSSSSVEVLKAERAYYAVNAAVNSLVAAGACPVGIMVNIILKQRTREIFLRRIVEKAEESCKSLAIDVLGCNAEVSAAVNCPVMTVTGVGKADNGRIIRTSGLSFGNEIVMTKWAGVEATAVLADEKRDILSKTLPDELINFATGMKDYVSVVAESAAAVDAGAKAMYSISQGGIFGALWEFCTASDVGITVDLRKIPIRQETIEICEVFDLNPYKMLSGGSLLIGCENGNRMVEKLTAAGIESAVIGYATDSNDRVVINGDEKRFLEADGGDDIYKLL